MTASRSCSVPTPLPIYLPHTYCVTQLASIPSHTPSPSMSPLVPPPTNVFEMQENRNHNAGTRHDSPIPISPTNTYSLTLRYPTGVDLPTYSPPLPTHNTYSLFLVSQPASISPYTHPTLSPYHLILRDATSVDLLTYTPHPLTIHTASFSCPN